MKEKKLAEPWKNFVIKLENVAIEVIKSFINKYQ